MENPLGFRVTDYRVDSDYSALPAAPASISTQAQAAPQASVYQQQMTPGMAEQNVAGAAGQAGSPMQQVMPTGPGSAPMQQQQPGYPGQAQPQSASQPQAQPTIQPQGMPNNVNGASGR